MSSDKNAPFIRDGLANELRNRLRDTMNEVLANSLPTSSCLSCVQFDEPNEICKLYKRRPPARVIAHGCPAYIDHYDIPY